MVGLITYVFSTIFVYVGEKDYERSVTSSRISVLAKTRSSTLTHGGANAQDVEAGSASSGAEIHTQIKRDTASSNAIESKSPMQAARSKFMFGFEHPEMPKRNTEKSRRALLY